MGKRSGKKFGKKQAGKSMILFVNRNGQIKASEKAIGTAKRIPMKLKTLWALAAMATPTAEKKKAEVPPARRSNVTTRTAKASTEDTPPPTTTTTPSTILAKNLPPASKPGRIVKPTKRFISEANESIEQSTKIVREPSNITEPETKVSNTEEVQAAKIRTISTPVPAAVGETTTNPVMRPKSLNIFGKNMAKSLQHPKVRHSRFFEMIYEKQHYEKKGANVNCQARAVENLQQYKEVVVENSQNETLSNDSEILNLVGKFQQIQNRGCIFDEFKSNFKAAVCNQWKPFEEDPKRKTEITSDKLIQAMKKVRINRLVDTFVNRNNSKEMGRKILIGMLNLLPDRPEVRHDFFTIHLPKLIAANKVTKKKGGTRSKKNATQVNPAYEIYF